MNQASSWTHLTLTTACEVKLHFHWTSKPMESLTETMGKTHMRNSLHQCDGDGGWSSAAGNETAQGGAVNNIWGYTIPATGCKLEPLLAAETADSEDSVQCEPQTPSPVQRLFLHRTSEEKAWSFSLFLYMYLSSFP